MHTERCTAHEPESALGVSAIHYGKRVRFYNALDLFRTATLRKLLLNRRRANSLATK